MVCRQYQHSTIFGLKAPQLEWCNNDWWLHLRKHLRNESVFRGRQLPRGLNNLMKKKQKNWKHISVNGKSKKILLLDDLNRHLW